MKKLLFLLIMVVAFACGEGSKSGGNEAGTNTEQEGGGANTNDETMSPDTTGQTTTQSDTTATGQGQQQ